MLFDVKIEEILSRIVVIEAEDMDSAERIAEEMYKNEEIVLDYSDLQGDATFYSQGGGYEDDNIVAENC